MTKQEFIERLCNGLSGLPTSDVEERLTFYSEMIDDRMEDGLSEEEAVLAVGTVEKNIADVVADTPLLRIAKERIKPKRRLKGWEIVLLVLGSPIWLSLVIAAVAVILSLYISLWCVIISLWAGFGSVVLCAFGGIASGIGFAFFGNTLTGVAVMGAGSVCLGLAIFMFFGFRTATNCVLLLTKKFAIWIKKCFIKKEEAQ